MPYPQIPNDTRLKRNKQPDSGTDTVISRHNKLTELTRVTYDDNNKQ